MEFHVIEGPQMALHPYRLPGPERGFEHPAEETDQCDESENQQPEPDKDEDLLVKEIDRQNALDDVTVQLVHVTYFKVAHGDARETFGKRPVLPAQQAFDNLHAEQMEIHAQERIEQI